MLHLSTLPVFRLLGIVTLVAGCLPVCSAWAQIPTEAGDEEYNRRLLIARIDGSHIGVVMHAPGLTYNGSPAWSPDGKMIAVDAWAPNPTGSGSKARIVVAHLDGTKTLVLGDGAMPSFSPDGTRIAFCRYSPQYGIWTQRIDEAGHAPEFFAQGWCGRWSPDGLCISYTTYENGGPNLCLQTIADGRRRFLFEAGDENPFRQIYWNYAWSLDGKSIACVAISQSGETEIATIDTHGARHGLTRHAIKPTDYQITWTPDRRVMFTMGPGPRQQLYTIDPAIPGDTSQLFALAPDRSIHGGHVSPDGTMIAFIMRQPLPDFAAR